MRHLLPWLKRSFLWSLTCTLVLGIWLWPLTSAQASIHVYRERPGQVTVRSRLSLRDYQDRAWQVIAFKRTQGTALQGYYLRLVGFPGSMPVDRQQPLTLMAPTGQSWQLSWAVDPQAKSLPETVGQFDLQPLLSDIKRALPLEAQLPLVEAEPAEMAIAPFIVQEWLDVKASTESPAPV
ncbi:MAG: DUF3122 domain-containing protein [Leptolyngbyaceae cyanobacterium]